MADINTLITATSQSDGYTFRLIWGLLAAPIGLALAFDYRNCAIVLFDFIERITPGGSGTASHNLVRLFGGVIGSIGIGVSVFAAYKLTFG
ncbi:hypothetical protein KBZ10_08395 [Streptomyces sp. F63]|uniref:hypothetical protein n=1 Tax=Streptomyces sp. F63 TaxID=2824887 RepID=UPI001B3928AE|nr:hypothetical protein [Streptomyces sp. F63]MBQ0984537.1 hypothetical protein [Streptomyces sp. F63]